MAQQEKRLLLDLVNWVNPQDSPGGRIEMAFLSYPPHTHMHAGMHTRTPSNTHTCTNPINVKTKQNNSSRSEFWCLPSSFSTEQKFTLNRMVWDVIIIGLDHKILLSVLRHDRNLLVRAG